MYISRLDITSNINANDKLNTSSTSNITTLVLQTIKMVIDDNNDNKYKISFNYLIYESSGRTYSPINYNYTGLTNTFNYTISNDYDDNNNILLMCYENIITELNNVNHSYKIYPDNYYPIIVLVENYRSNGDSSHIFITRNDGTSYTDVNLNITGEGSHPVTNYARYLYISPKNYNMLIVPQRRNSKHGMYSLDSGNTWSTLNCSNGHNWKVDCGLSLDGKTMYVVGGQSYSKSWYSFDTGTTCSYNNTRYQRESFISSKGNIFILMRNWGGTIYHYLYKSTNAINFSSYGAYYNFNISDNKKQPLSFTMASDESVFYIGNGASTTCKIARTTDITDSWEYVTIYTQASESYTYVHCNALNGKFLIVYYNLKAWISRDYGVTFNIILSTKEVSAASGMFISRSGRFIAIPDNNTNGRYYYSKDYGSTWVEKNKTVSAGVYEIGIQDPL